MHILIHEDETGDGLVTTEQFCVALNAILTADGKLEVTKDQLQRLLISSQLN